MDQPKVRLGSLVFNVPDPAAAGAWLQTVFGAVDSGPVAEHCVAVELDGLCLDLSSRWHTRAYFTVDDLDAFHAHCLEKGAEVISPPHETGVGGARLMEIAGAGMRLYVIDHQKTEEAQ